jgi:hypothetical protein
LAGDRRAETDPGNECFANDAAGPKLPRFSDECFPAKAA